MNAIEKKAIDTIRILAAETVQKAKSGHPGTPIGIAPVAYAIWKQMKHDPSSPDWTGRDRFVLSAGHASSLEYALLHLFGYGLTVDDLKQFRQWGSKTPGHPEYGHTRGVEATTGPLGQGVAMAVGMAMAERYLAAKFNRDGFPIVDNHTYALCGDGCVMEGVTSEAASLAGHLKLGKLILVYDSNRITIEGGTELAFGDDVAMRYASYGWHVVDVPDGNDIDAFNLALGQAKAEGERPSLIIVHTEIGHGSPVAGTAKVHGEPLGDENIKAMKQFYNWTYEEAFTVPEDVRAHYRTLSETCAKPHKAHKDLMAAYRAAYPALYAEWEAWHDTALPDGLKNDARLWNAEGPKATRNVSGDVLNIMAEYMPNLFGGSADLAPSNKTAIKGRAGFAADAPDGSNIHFGVREFAMACACNGIALYGGLRTYCATFMVFADYLKPAMRLAALMNLPVIYVLTHDSIGVGEDGPTHEPIEQLAMMRSTPNVLVFRPADAKETSACYIAALESGRPSAIALTRQNLPQYAETGTGAYRGAYVLRDAENGRPDVILMASGSEVEIACKAQELLKTKDVHARVVSVPCMELFNEQDASYQAYVLPSAVRARVAVEAGASFGWHRYTGLDGRCVCIDTFGASAPFATLFEKFGFTAENVANQALMTLQSLNKQ